MKKIAQIFVWSQKVRTSTDLINRSTDQLTIPLNKSPCNRRLKRQAWKCWSSRCYWAGITWNVTIREFWSWKQRLENFPFNNWSQCWHHGSTYGCFFEISTIWRIFFKVEIVKEWVMKRRSSFSLGVKKIIVTEMFLKVS